MGQEESKQRDAPNLTSISFLMEFWPLVSSRQYHLRRTGLIPDPHSFCLSQQIIYGM